MPENQDAVTAADSAGPGTFYIKTFGCQMNVHDSERMAGLMTSAGYLPVDDPAEARVILVNTCTVRDKADQKALSDLGRLRRFKKGDPDLILAVTGCMAEREQDNLHRMMPEIDLVAGPSQVRNLLPMLDDARRKMKVRGGEYALPEMTTPPALRPPGVSALVTVQEGCDKACAYCVVPRTRGVERSRTLSSIVEEVRELVASGYREITLLGQNVNGFGKSLSTPGPDSFADLLRALDGVEGLLRIRFTTSHPQDMSLEMVQAMADCPKVMPHLHLPLQSGSDTVLARMERGYTMSAYRRWIAMVRDGIPGVAITTDFILGFCGETEEEFGESLAAVSEFDFDGAFCFIYSPRPGTPAFAWGEIPSREVSVERFHRMEEVLDSQILRKNRSLIGTVAQVLVDRIDLEHGRIVGRTPGFRQVRGHRASGSVFPEPGTLVDVLIGGCTKAGLSGDLV